MGQQKKSQGDSMSSGSKRDSGMTGLSKKDSSGARGDGRTQNGNRGGFRTDSAITVTNPRSGSERELTPWSSDSTTALDGSLEQLSSGGGWDQFAGLKSNYDENFYTTAIDTADPNYEARLLAADSKAREIERSAPITSHVAEERVMDHKGTDNNSGDEEDKYSGVRRHDASSLLASTGRGNKYTPPAKRAPAGQPTVPGVPVDPAIISSQIRGMSPKKTDSPKLDENHRATPAATSKLSRASAANNAAVSSTKRQPKADEAPKNPTELKILEAAQSDSKTAFPKPVNDKLTSVTRPTGSSTRNQFPQPNETGPSAASTIERDVLKEFKSFATQQRLNAEKARSNKAKEVKLTELKKFADTFKLSTPVPEDLISIIAKDPEKQREIREIRKIQAKALQNAAKVKAETATSKNEEASVDNLQVKSIESSTVPSSTEPKTSVTPQFHGTPPSGVSNRQPRQSSGPTYHAQQPVRHGGSGPHVPQQTRTGNLRQRLRGHGAPEDTTHQHGMPTNLRPPTGPAATIDPGFNRRLSGTHGHLGAKLNPNSHEFRPNPYGSSFSPNGHPSAGSSPRAGASNMNDISISQTPPGQLIRRKTKAVDPSKCSILAFIQTISPPQGRNWDDNDGLRPSYDTLPTWRQIQEGVEKPDSTMHLTYKEYFERHPFVSASVATPNPTPSVPHMIHQLSFHPGMHPPGNRSSPQIQPIQMVPHMPPHHVPFSDDRMMHSNSQHSVQAYTSPRLPTFQPNMAYRFMNGNVVNGNMPQVDQFRASWGQGIMMPPHQMPVYAVSQFVPTPGPSQPITNGMPSPGTAPQMAQRNSQQGMQTPFAMSPNMNMPYQSPYSIVQNKITRPPSMAVNNQPIHQHFGRGNGSNGNNVYGSKNFGAHIQQPSGQVTGIPTGQQVRSSEVQEDIKS